MTQNQKIIANFETKFVPVPESGCWLWTAGLTGHGYGAFWLNKKQTPAHRVSYELYIKKIPSGMVVCHKCDIPSCVNPDHLFIGTQADNIKDRDKKGRHWVPKGSESATSKLTDADVLMIRNDTRAQRTIAIDYSINQSLVSLIKAKKRWRHL